MVGAVTLLRPPHQLTATVLGAGTMGAQIAAHLANAGVHTHLLDIVPKGATGGQRNALLLRNQKGQPHGFVAEPCATGKCGPPKNRHDSGIARLSQDLESVIAC